MHFFLNPIRVLQKRGHEVLVTSRDKEMALVLLDKLEVTHTCLSTSPGKGPFGLLIELLRRDFALAKLVGKFKPDVMAAIGGIFVAQVGAIKRTPSVVFYDTENAKLQNALTYPFASLTVVPQCYEAWLPRKHRKYRGYHELSYLHPRVFTPDRNAALANGLSDEVDTFIVRVVSWSANHDIGEVGWSEEALFRVVEHLSQRGKVIVSSESPLPTKLEQYAYCGDPTQIHQIMAFSRLFVGESATMASESVVLGVPAIYAATTGRGYSNEQEFKYGMLKNVRAPDAQQVISAIDQMLSINTEEFRARHQAMLEDMIDVPTYVADTIEAAAQRHVSASEGA